MGSTKARQLKRHEAQGAVRSLLRLVAAWELAERKKLSNDVTVADEAVLLRVVNLLAKHEHLAPVAAVVREGKTKKGKTGPTTRYTPRRADVLQLRVQRQLVRAVDRLVAGRVQAIGFARAVARTLKPYNPTVTMKQVLEATLTDEEDADTDVLADTKGRTQSLRAWVTSEGGRVDAADTLMRKIGRGSGPGRLRSERYGQIVRGLLPEAVGLKPPPPLTALESKFKGGTIGTVALLKTALTALGYKPNRIDRAVAALLRAEP